ncbi:hypothetical protein EG834_09550 [bacterium]|nr:hypothetical protein [bacterium]
MHYFFSCVKKVSKIVLRRYTQSSFGLYVLDVISALSATIEERNQLGLRCKKCVRCEQCIFRQEKPTSISGAGGAQNRQYMR